MKWQSAHSAVRSSAVVLCAGGYLSLSAQWCASVASCWPHSRHLPSELANASLRARKNTGWR